MCFHRIAVAAATVAVALAGSFSSFSAAAPCEQGHKCCRPTSAPFHRCPS